MKYYSIWPDTSCTVSPFHALHETPLPDRWTSHWWRWFQHLSKFPKKKYNTKMEVYRNIIFLDSLMIFLIYFFPFFVVWHTRIVRWKHWTEEIISHFIFTGKLTSVLLISLFFVGLTVLRPGFIRFHNIIIGFHGDGGFSRFGGLTLQSIVELSLKRRNGVQKQSCPMSPPHHALLGAGRNLWCVAEVARFKWSITARSSRKTKNLCDRRVKIYFWMLDPCWGLLF